MSVFATLAAGLLLVSGTGAPDKLRAERGCAKAPKPAAAAPAARKVKAVTPKASANSATDEKKLVASRCQTPAQRWTPGSF